MSLKAAQAQVRAFREATGLPVGDGPGLRNEHLHADLLDEEYRELLDAFERDDLPAAIDALLDIQYLCIGAACDWGVDLEEPWEAVRAANMAKVGGTRRADGKLLKPPGWTPPDIAALIEKQRRKP